jgi:hypothetical protein
MSKLKMGFLIISCILFLLLAGCSDLNNPDPVVDEQAVTSDLNAELARVMECYQEALLNNDPAAVDKLIGILEDFDARYNSQLASEFKAYLQEKQARLTEPINDFPPLYDLPIENDGDVYLAGGANSLAGYLVDWVAPNVTAANYNHGAILDLNKFDPTNLDASCFQTAVEKGAGYETPWEWMKKQNVGVMSPVSSLNPSALNSAQAAMDYYCNPNNTNMAYGFFEDTINIFNLVTKSDNYYWYCTKVVWRVYNDLGINIDSDSPLIDWTTSGLYSIVKAYYNIIYFWSSSKAKKALNSFINKARKTIVLSEEIYFSPTMSLHYEVIR